jgi:curved DNA-binding protein CbpA
VAQPKTVEQLRAHHGSTLYGLWLIGAVELRSGDPATTAPNLPGVGSQAAAAELEAKLREAETRWASASHFEVLGVGEDARDEDVRQAFMNLAKTYHPDKVGRRAPSLTELAAKVFARISEANDALGRPDMRAAYLAVRRKDWEAALEALRWALELDANEGEFHALRGWVVFLKNQDQKGGDMAEALDHIKKGLTLAPQSPTPYYYLGQIRKACGDHAEAEKMFRKTIELRPNHVEASRELRLIQLRRAKGDETVTGRLFGRKKK